jgi:hypothetical protein
MHSTSLRARVASAAVLLATAAVLPAVAPPADATGAAPAPAPTTAATDPGTNVVDLAQVTVSSTRKRVRFTFGYDHTFTAPDPASGGDITQPYWWGATVYFDTSKKRKGPEYAAFLTNQCGDGYVIGRVVRKHAHGSSYLAIAPEWEGGCGPKRSCARTAKVRYADDLGSLRSITFRRVKGCYDARKVRVSAEFRTGPFGATASSWDAARDQLDEFPGARLGEYTGWTRTGHGQTFADLSPGLVLSTGVSQAP